MYMLRLGLGLGLGLWLVLGVIFSITWPRPDTVTYV